MDSNTNQARVPDSGQAIIQPDGNIVAASPYYDFEPNTNGRTRIAWVAGKEAEENEWLRRKLATAGQLGRVSADYQGHCDRLRAEGNATTAAFVWFMRDRDRADYEEVDQALGRNHEDTSIRSLVSRANEDLVDFPHPIPFFDTRGGRINKTIIP
jgi:hypothetical protein